MAPNDLITVRSVCWRVHRTQGRHVLAWDEFRRSGPVSSARFDPHPLPAGVHPGWGVLYAAADSTTAIAEAYQVTRLVNTTSGLPSLTAWRPTRELRLLDLTGAWALRNGASASLTAAPRPTCRNWAHAIRTRWPELDGLYVTSTMTGAVTTVLWEPARDSVPAEPDFSRPLGHPVVWDLARRAAIRIGYDIL